MHIRYGEPLSRGFNRMKNALFTPFDPGKWFAVGFTAFLAGLADGSGFSNGSFRSGKHNWNFENLPDFPHYAREWMLDNPIWSLIIIFGILLLIAFGILLTWLSSRGMFMFLDNVVHNRALVSRPWSKYKFQGNSLFLWRLCFGIIMLIVISIFLLAAGAVFYYFHGSSFSGLAAGLTIAGMVLWFFAIAVITGYITLFLSHFIVPIMYKKNIGALQAWKLFMPLLRRYIFQFILYGIVIFLLYIPIIACIIIIGLFTCCIGLLLLSIPYIGSVLMLPVTYTFRAMSVEFLEQFGSEYEIFPEPDDNDIHGVYEL